MEETEKALIKKVRFDFLREGHIGCLHVDVDCETIEDLKKAIVFAEEASKLVPPMEIGRRSEKNDR